MANHHKGIQDYRYEEWMRKAVQDASSGRGQVLTNVPAAYQDAYQDAYRFGQYLAKYLRPSSI